MANSGGIKRMEEFYHAIDMPTSIRELGVDLTEDQIEELSHKCTFMETRTIGQFKVLDKNDIANIYRMAM